MFIVLFHSMFGLRAVELAAAEQLRAAGCQVVVPDLFAGATAPGDVDAGFALMDQVGWGTIVDRARRGVAGVPREAVLGLLARLQRRPRPHAPGRAWTRVRRLLDEAS